MTYGTLSGSPDRSAARPPRVRKLPKREAAEREKVRILISAATATSAPAPDFPSTWRELRELAEKCYYAPMGWTQGGPR